MTDEQEKPITWQETLEIDRTAELRVTTPTEHRGSMFMGLGGGDLPTRPAKRADLIEACKAEGIYSDGIDIACPNCNASEAQAHAYLGALHQIGRYIDAPPGNDPLGHPEYLRTFLCVSRNKEAQLKQAKVLLDRAQIVFAGELSNEIREWLKAQS